MKKKPSTPAARRRARAVSLAKDHPNLPIEFIEGILQGQAELRAGRGRPYQWGVHRRRKVNKG